MLTINLLPGHGISNIKNVLFDPGAKNKNGTQEATGTKILGDKLKSKLEFNGFKVNLLNDRDVNAQINFVNNNKCDLAIALHFNAFNEKVSGVEVLYSDVAPGYNKNTTLKFADILLNQLIKDTGMVNRGLKKTNSGVGIIKRTKFPTVLSENGFIDHPTEYLWAKDDNKLNILAESHCKAVCEYFGIEYKDNKNQKEIDSDMTILQTKNSIQFNYNGENKEIENYIINDTSYVNTRQIIDLFSKILNYDENIRTIFIKDNIVKIDVNGNIINGQLIDDKSFCPVRELCKSLDKTVEWDMIDRKVIIK